MKSERGFTLLELILVMVVMGIISSTLVLPFLAGLKQSTRPEIYATATYLAQEVLEEYKGNGYTYVKTNNSTLIGDPISPPKPDVPKKGRSYSLVVRAGYVDDPSDTSLDTSNATDYIRVKVTVSNSINNVELWTILVKDFFDPNANS